MGPLHLCRPKWNQRQLWVCAASMELLTDQPMLTKLVRTDADWTVHRATLKKLTDQALLTELATARAEAEEREVRKSTVRSTLLCPTL